MEWGPPQCVLRPGYLLSRELEDFVWSSETLDDIVKGVRDGKGEVSMQTCSTLKTLDIAFHQLFVQAVAHNLTLPCLFFSSSRIRLGIIQVESGERRG